MGERVSSGGCSGGIQETEISELEIWRGVGDSIVKGSGCGWRILEAASEVEDVHDTYYFFLDAKILRVRAPRTSEPLNFCCRASHFL